MTLLEDMTTDEIITFLNEECMPDRWRVAIIEKANEKEVENCDRGGR
jgi:hypothetical protein